MQITFGLEAFKLIIDDIDKVANNPKHNKEFAFKDEKATALKFDQQFKIRTSRCEFTIQIFKYAFI